MTLKPTQVRNRYFRELGISSVLYVAGILLAARLIDDGDPLTVGNMALVALPAVALLMMVVAMWRYFASVDEVLRAYYSRALLVAAFAVLAISGSWGLFELMNESFPRLPVFFVFPIFMGIFGLASCLKLGRSGMGS